MKHELMVKINIEQLDSMRFNKKDWNTLIDICHFTFTGNATDNVTFTCKTEYMSKYVGAILGSDGTILTVPFNNINRLKNKIKYAWEYLDGCDGYLIAEAVHG